MVLDDESDYSLNFDENAVHAWSGKDRWYDDNAWLDTEDVAAMCLAETTKSGFIVKLRKYNDI